VVFPEDRTSHRPETDLFNRRDGARPPLGGGGSTKRRQVCVKRAELYPKGPFLEQKNWEGGGRKEKGKESSFQRDCDLCVASVVQGENS